MANEEKLASDTRTPDTLAPTMAKAKDVKDVAIDTPPSAETLKKISEYTVLDRKREKHTFKSIYDGPVSDKRVLVIFIRHFFCGVRSYFSPDTY